MPTPPQSWLRAELIAGPETTPGAQLLLPADGVEFHDDQLVFHHQGDVVYVAHQGQLRSITWFAKQPNPDLARRRAQWPNAGTRWTDQEREDLRRRLKTGQSWQAISAAHGRSRTGCQQEAVKQGWLDPDTLRISPTLLLPADQAEAATPEATTPSTATDPAADLTPTANPTLAANPTTDQFPTAPTAEHSDTPPEPAPDSAPAGSAHPINSTHSMPAHQVLIRFMLFLPLFAC